MSSYFYYENYQFYLYILIHGNKRESTTLILSCSRSVFLPNFSKLHNLFSVKTCDIYIPLYNYNSYICLTISPVILILSLLIVTLQLNPFSSSVSIVHSLDFSLQFFYLSLFFLFISWLPGYQPLAVSSRRPHGNYIIWALACSKCYCLYLRK